MADLQKITPFLWFDGRAQEAAEFYVSIFPDSCIVNSSPLPGVQAEGAALVTFVLAGQDFTALDGGPMFQFSPAISFVINCETQEEIDHYWFGLSKEGAQQPGGWVEDKFGLSWQISPVQLESLLAANPDRVMEALLQMKRLDLAALEAAANRE